MGGCNSCCIPHQNPNKCRENHVSFKSHKRNLSATFNFDIDRAPSVEQLNVNMASEEELMTLPGINRATAQNIVDYRRQIGGFKKVEDLALVSGVGATKLQVLRLEICVGAKRNGSNKSSPSGSKADLTQNDKAVKPSGVPLKVNINTANVFQLMKVKGIGQSIAENIVAYRDKKGEFRTVDDLTKVRGIGHVVLSAIRHQLTVSGSPVHMNGSLPRSASNTSQNKLETYVPLEADPEDVTPEVPDEKEDDAGPLQHPNTAGSAWDISAIAGPIAEKSIRPHVEPFKFKTKNRKAMRIASWNVLSCGLEKIGNPGVREVICMTILENGFSLIAFQEIADADTLQKICDELNSPTVPHVKKWKGHRGKWECVTSGIAGNMFQSSEYNGFVYDVSQGVELINSALVDRPRKRWPRWKQFARRPFMAVFRVDKFDFVAVSVHLKATGLKMEDLERLQEEIATVPLVLEAVEEQLPGERDILVLGDFNLNPGATDFDGFRNAGYKNTVDENTPTNIHLNNMKGSRTYDNIWMSPQAQKVHTGNAGVIREGLTSIWIPDGWRYGGLVSDHTPVWGEFYTGTDLDEGVDLSGGVAGIRIEPGTS